MGGKSHWLDGTAKDAYYFIKHHGDIVCIYKQQEGYTLVDIHIYGKPKYPKQMYVSDVSVEDACFLKNVKTVIAEIELDGHTYYITGVAMQRLLWNFAVDIPQPLRLTRKQIAEKFGVEKVEIID